MIVCIPSDSGDPTYDLFVTVDRDKFTAVQAFDAIKKAVEDTKAARPDDHMVEDLWERLPDGIEPCDNPFLMAPVEW